MTSHMSSAPKLADRRATCWIANGKRKAYRIQDARTAGRRLGGQGDNRSLYVRPQQGPQLFQGLSRPAASLPPRFPHGAYRCSACDLSYPRRSHRRWKHSSPTIFVSVRKIGRPDRRDLRRGPVFKKLLTYSEKPPPSPSDISNRGRELIPTKEEAIVVLFMDSAYPSVIRCQYTTGLGQR